MNPRPHTREPAALCHLALFSVPFASLSAHAERPGLSDSFRTHAVQPFFTLVFLSFDLASSISVAKRFHLALETTITAAHLTPSEGLKP
ncbi:hypothetical protein SKAU_G00009480 [Synaphobranchus kaupii]|uniref:Uncharacterized protein n=1 Tax=Synaphobranchus kaupii TaxID=118154 RepID=A0A9Q1GAS3_SYNKA|nr:hypothetical protein SKAU_G00009480 [Synaphobranchus kaupii]